MRCLSCRATSASVVNHGAPSPRISADVISGNSSANVDAMATPADSPQITARDTPRWRSSARASSANMRSVWFCAEVPDRPDDRRS